MASVEQAQIIQPKGLGWKEPLLVASGVVTALWGVWITKEVRAEESGPPIVKVQLQQVVGEYIQAQARSSTPPEQVTAETKAFMAEVQNNLSSRGKKGQIVLVAEAIVSDNVPDITSDVRNQVFKKVKMPSVAAVQPNNVMGAMQQVMAQPPAPGVMQNGPAN
jgi:hypothetical protein